jgi:Condensation domain
MSVITPPETTAAQLRELAERLAAKPALLPAALRGDGALYPLSQAQQHLFARQQMDEQDTAYNIAAGLAVDGELDEPQLRAAVSLLLRRHEALRTRFAYRDGQVWQRVAAATEAQADYRYRDLSTLPAEQAEAAALAELHAEAVRPFDLLAGPLLRFQLLRTGAARYLLGLHVHHIVADYMSMDLLVRELSQLFLAPAGQLENQLAPLSLHFADYCLWERAFLDAEPARRQREYWLQRLAEAPVLSLPPVVHAAATENEGGWCGFRLDAEVLQKLRTATRASGLTSFMLGIAALHQLVAALSGQDDISIGTPISTRRVPELEHCVGLLLNTLVIRIDAAGCDSGADFLAETRRRCTEAFEHKDFPYEGLLRELQQRRGEAEPYRVRYVYRRLGAGTAAQVPTLTASEIQLQRREAKFDLLVSLNETDEGLFGEFEYRRAALDADSAEDLAALYGQALSSLATAAAQPLAGLRRQLAQGLQEAAAQRRRQRSSGLGQRLQSLLRRKSDGDTA